MLSDKKRWQLWGFASDKAVYFDIRNTRSGDVIEDFLKNSQEEYLMSDAYAAYFSSIKKVNEYRKENNINDIKQLNCNAHSRRKFNESKDNYPDISDFFIRCYQKIYKIQKKIKLKKLNIDIEFYRKLQSIFFKAMKK